MHTRTVMLPVSDAVNPIPSVQGGYILAEGIYLQPRFIYWKQLWVFFPEQSVSFLLVFTPPSCCFCLPQVLCELGPVDSH